MGRFANKIKITGPNIFLTHWWYLYHNIFHRCRLAGNPICNSNRASARFCSSSARGNDALISNNCGGISCSKDEALSPNCKCGHPYTGTLHFFSFSFTDLQNSSYYGILHGSLMSALLSHGLPVDSIKLINSTIDMFSYLKISLQIFPSSQDSFNRTSVSSIGYVLNRQPFKIELFGPFFFIDEQYCCFEGDDFVFFSLVHILFFPWILSFSIIITLYYLTLNLVLKVYFYSHIWSHR